MTLFTPSEADKNKLKDAFRATGQKPTKETIYRHLSRTYQMPEFSSAAININYLTGVYNAKVMRFDILNNPPLMRANVDRLVLYYEIEHYWCLNPGVAQRVTGMDENHLPNLQWLYSVLFTLNPQHEIFVAPDIQIARIVEDGEEVRNTKAEKELKKKRITEHFKEVTDKYKALHYADKLTVRIATLIRGVTARLGEINAESSRLIMNVILLSMRGDQVTAEDIRIAVAKLRDHTAKILAAVTSRKKKEKIMKKEKEAIKKDLMEIFNIDRIVPQNNRILAAYYDELRQIAERFADDEKEDRFEEFEGNINRFIDRMRTNVANSQRIEQSVAIPNLSELSDIIPDFSMIDIRRLDDSQREGRNNNDPLRMNDIIVDILPAPHRYLLNDRIGMVNPQLNNLVDPEAANNNPPALEQVRVASRNSSTIEKNILPVTAELRSPEATEAYQLASLQNLIYSQRRQVLSETITSMNAVIRNLERLAVNVETPDSENRFRSLFRDLQEGYNDLIGQSQSTQETYERFKIQFRRLRNRNKNVASIDQLESTDKQYKQLLQWYKNRLAKMKANLATAKVAFNYLLKNRSDYTGLSEDSILSTLGISEIDLETDDILSSPLLAHIPRTEALEEDINRFKKKILDRKNKKDTNTSKKDSEMSLESRTEHDDVDDEIRDMIGDLLPNNRNNVEDQAPVTNNIAGENVTDQNNNSQIINNDDTAKPPEPKKEKIIPQRTGQTGNLPSSSGQWVASRAKEYSDKLAKKNKAKQDKANKTSSDRNVNMNRDPDNRETPTPQAPRYIENGVELEEYDINSRLSIPMVLRELMDMEDYQVAHLFENMSQEFELIFMRIALDLYRSREPNMRQAIDRVVADYSIQDHEFVKSLYEVKWKQTTSK